MASVKIKPNIVAIFGAIMPEPFAMALIVTVVLPIFVLHQAAFGYVSVVIIALAASTHGELYFLEHSSGKAERIESIGNTSPITPVDATNTFSGRHEACLPINFDVSLTAFNPKCHV